jgi:drug/metabolite transporter (DMT)-like permease
VIPSETAILVLPLLAAVLFTSSALFLKRSSELGAGLWRTAFVSNFINAVLFCTLLGMDAPPVRWELLWQPFCIAVCLFSGLMSQFVSFEKGDVSITVPVLGLKVVGVALLVPFFTQDHVDARAWGAAALSVAGIALLNRKHRDTPSRNVGVTVFTAGLTAAIFAVFDVLVQRWGPAWGAGRLLPIVYAFNALFSLALIPKFGAPLSALPTQTLKWLVPGALLLGAQSIVFVGTLAIYGKAAVVNVIYSSRGLLSVAAVWLAGHWFKNTERHLGPRVLLWRLLGAVLMLSAIVLVITR